MEETKKYQVVDSVEKLEDTIARVRAAQKKFAEYLSLIHISEPTRP